jgi:hypothetical protein
VSRFDAMVGRWAGFGVYDIPAADAAVPEPVPAENLYTCYADTGPEVEAAELDVIGELHDLVSSWRLSPWQAAFALFNPVSEGDADVA